jgi:hypothetical protein
MNPLIPGIAFNQLAPYYGGQFGPVKTLPSGSWQAQGGAGGIYGQGHTPIGQQPQVMAAVSTSQAIMMIPR